MKSLNAKVLKFKSWNQYSRIAYICLFFVLLVSILVYYLEIIGAIENKFVVDLFPNLIIELISILFIVAILENIHSLEHERERRRLEKIAVRQIKIELIHLINISFKMLIASHDKNDVTKFNNEAITIEEIDSYLVEFRYFDKNQSWGDEEKRSYSLCISDISCALTDVEKKINNVLSRYAIYININFVESLDSILNNEFLKNITSCDQLYKYDEIKKYFIELFLLVNTINSILIDSSIINLSEIWNENIVYAGECRLPE